MSYKLIQAQAKQSDFLCFDSLAMNYIKTKDSLFLAHHLTHWTISQFIHTVNIASKVNNKYVLWIKTAFLTTKTEILSSPTPAAKVKIKWIKQKNRK